MAITGDGTVLSIADKSVSEQVIAGDRIGKLSRHERDCHVVPPRNDRYGDLCHSTLVEQSIGENFDHVS